MATEGAARARTVLIRKQSQTGAIGRRRAARARRRLGSVGASGGSALQSVLHSFSRGSPFPDNSVESTSLVHSR